ncbi:carbohydrate-binding protein [Peterkaempfera bronchialis]|uniref:carbohydrate-binding protein n=1 Tax=Peterkaempfera bronchialis TaxID=2126346 RepID=UPI0013B45E7F|nr:carbohydrate-binding protein [Peterkaempfera bronchialis]
MTAGSNGVPEDDDPFGYLYRPSGGGAGNEGVDGAAPTVVQQPGVPRTSYAQPTQVGRAQYGQRPPAQPAYGQTVPHQHAPYAQHSRPQPGADGYDGYDGHDGGGRGAGRGGGGRSRGLVFGAIAVVAAIVIGASFAFMNDDDKGDKGAAGQASQSPSAAASDSGDSSASPSPSASSEPVADASSLQVQGGAQGSGIQGAKSSDGKYVTLQQGTALTWKVQPPSAGQYKFWVHYDNPGADAQAAVSINGEQHGGGIKLTNWAKSSDPERAWVSSYSWLNLKAGANTIVVTCDNPGCAGLLVDKVAISPMSVSVFPG